LQYIFLQLITAKRIFLNIMGSGLSSSKGAASKHANGSESLESLNVAIAMQLRKFNLVAENGPKDQRYTPIATDLVELLIQKAYITDDIASLDCCINILERLVEDDGVNITFETYLWSLLNLARVKQERFQILSQDKNIDNASNSWNSIEKSSEKMDWNCQWRYVRV
jgi:hypothetical protein